MKKIEIVQALMEINKRLDSLSIHKLIGEIIESNNLPCPCPACAGMTEKKEDEKSEDSPKKEDLSNIGVIAGTGGREEMLTKLKEVLDTVKSGNLDKLKEMADESAKRLGKKKTEKIQKMVKEHFKNKG